MFCSVSGESCWKFMWRNCSSFGMKMGIRYAGGNLGDSHRQPALTVWATHVKTEYIHKSNDNHGENFITAYWTIAHTRRRPQINDIISQDCGKTEMITELANFHRAILNSAKRLATTRNWNVSNDVQLLLVRRRWQHAILACRIPGGPVNACMPICLSHFKWKKNRGAWGKKKHQKSALKNTKQIE